MESHNEFVQKLAALHEARKLVARDKAADSEIMAAFYAEHADRVAGMLANKEALANIDAEVRAQALTLYRADPTVGKTGLPGVTIRDTKAIGWEPAAALAWAKEHGVALKLDEAAYRKLVGIQEAPGTVTTDFTVAIAADLTPVIRARS